MIQYIRIVHFFQHFNVKFHQPDGFLRLHLGKKSRRRAFPARAGLQNA